MVKTGSFVAFSTAQEAAVIKHVLGQRIESPKVAFAGIAWFAGHLDEAIIKAEVMTDGILPGGEFVFVVGKPNEMKAMLIKSGFER